MFEEAIGFEPKLKQEQEPKKCMIADVAIDSEEGRITVWKALLGEKKEKTGE